MEAMRQSWTDDRLDDFAGQVWRRFDEVDRRFDDVDRRFGEVNGRLDRLEDRDDVAGDVGVGLRVLQRPGAAFAPLLLVLVYGNLHSPENSKT